MRFFLVVVFVLVVGAAAVAYGWLNGPLEQTTDTVDLSIEPGSNGREIAQSVADAGIAVHPDLLYLWFRVSGQSRQIKAGSYEIDRGTTPQSLLRKLVRGEEALRSVTLVEGWTFRQVRDALRKADSLKPDSQALSADDTMGRLGRAGVTAEGRFFPDTYTYSKGSSDLAVLQRAMRAMDKRLDAVWSQRDPQTPLKSPGELLTLASIVEKETGAPADRAEIAAVFTNRLRIGMRLQTDPTVIYGMGPAFDGNLRKKDLQTDTPWNTYTRDGLPPTPIAIPGKAALLAAARPATSKALYFVARGDGTSQFSTSLDAHNRAVNTYQRGQ
ncbi:MAG: endolytic transglycosylase MltG [Burkholderiales bacterium]|nr:endolytic transglycosylase MltG [Burkholderiales bacterium]